MVKRKSKNSLIKLCRKYGKSKPIEISIEPTSLSFQGKGKTLIYVKLSNHKVFKTKEIKQNELYVDFDRKDEIVGIEIL